MADNKKQSGGMKFRGGKPASDSRNSYASDRRNSYGDNRKKSFGGNSDGKRYGDRQESFGKKYGDKPDFRKNKSDDRQDYRGKKSDDRQGNGGRRFDDRQNDRRSYDDRRTDRYVRDHGRQDFDNNIREDELPFLIMGRNAVREAIKSGRSIDKLLVIPEHDGSLGEIVSLARDRNILIQEERREKLDELCMPFGHGEKTGNHQGIVARVPGADYVDIDDILAYARERGEKPFVLLLDGITDPYNFGSIIRSAECAGVHGIIIPKRRSATLTSSAVKVSAGAASHMRIAKVPNIAVAIDRLKEENIFIAGTDMQGQPMYETDLRGAMGLVIGSEDEGLSALVAKKCDFIISAPIKGHIDSLNAAVASAVIMYEKVRQDMIK